MISTKKQFKALKFFQKACGLNDGGGCFNLGLMYEKGKGVRKSNTKALRKSKIKATTAKIQITRLLVKLERLEIILFNAFASAIQIKARALERVIPKL
jgi:TPR repeat protein